jgi:hypothetical protein
MKRLFVISLFFFSNVLFGQEANSKWAISLQQSVDATYRITSSTEDLSWLKNQVDSSETWKTGYSSSIQLNYQVNNRFSFSSGLSYEYKGEQLRTNALLNMKYYKTSYRFVGVPVIFNYSCPLQKGSLIFGIGPEFLIYSGTLAHYQMNNSNSDVRIFLSNANSNSFLLGSIANFAYELNFYRNFRFQLGILYKQQITSLSSTEFSRKPFSIGCQVSLIKSI